jgi:hypothetical protein
MIRSRRRVQRRRQRRDEEFLTSKPQPVFFDVDTYRPKASVLALVSVLSRLYAVAPDPRLERVLTRVKSAEDSDLRHSPARVAAMVRESGMSLQPGLEWLLRAMEAGAD